jgi:polyhydroxyalkanoate synthesis repressor PhaR
MAERLLIKKYTNRRLYDTERSTYISLQDLADAVKRGRRVEVIDAKTQKDVTAFILTQVILEEARNNHILLPVELLHLFIRYGENVLAEFFEKYLQQTITNYLTFKSAADDQFKKWLDLSMDVSTAAQKTMTGLTPFKSFLDLFAPPADKQDEEQGG